MSIPAYATQTLSALYPSEPTEEGLTPVHEAELAYQLFTELGAVPEFTAFAFTCREQLLTGISDFAETSLPDPSELDSDQLRKVQESFVRYILTSGTRGFKDGIDEVEFDENPLVGRFIDRRGNGDRIFSYEISNESGQWVSTVRAVSGVEDSTFSEVLSDILFGSWDYAAKGSGKKKNCNPAKSHFCQTETGSGSCVPLSRQCRYKPQGDVKDAANAVGKQVRSSKKKTQNQQPDPQKAPAKSSDSDSGAVTMTADGIPSRVPGSISEMKDYTRKWQKDRGYDKNPPDPGFDIHDTNHGLMYLATNRTPESIQTEFGYSGKKYDGKPDLAEEAFVLIAEAAFLKKSTKEMVIDHAFSVLYAGAGSGSVLYKGRSNDEIAFYADESARKKDLERMYNEVVQAPQPVKDLLAKNSARTNVIRDGFVDSYSDKTIKRKYKDAFADFAAMKLDAQEAELSKDLNKRGLSNEQIASFLTRRQYSIDNIAGKREYMSDIFEQKLKMVEEEDFALES